MSALDLCPVNAPFFGFMGVASALVFSNLGAAYGTAKAGVGLCSMGVLKPDLVMKSIIPVVMAGVLGIYGLIVSVILTTNIKQEEYSSFSGYAHLASGLACGLSGLAAGICIGIVGDAGVRANAQQVSASPRVRPCPDSNRRPSTSTPIVKNRRLTAAFLLRSPACTLLWC